MTTRGPAAWIVAALVAVLGGAAVPSRAVVAASLPPAGHAGVIAFGDALHGWAANGASKVATMDGGATWTDQTLPGGILDLTRLTALGASHAWAVGDAGTSQNPQPVIVGTSNGGTTWTQESVPSGVGALNAITFVDAQHGWAAGGNAGIGSTAGEVIVTSNGGATWARQTLPSTITLTFLFGVSFVDTLHGWLGGTSGACCPPNHDEVILSTTDGGATWTSATSPHVSSGYAITGMQFVDVSHGWVLDTSSNPEVGASFTSIARTTDGDSTWQAASPGNACTIDDVHFFDASTGWAVGRATAPPPTNPAAHGCSAVSASMWTTHDAGTTWTQETIPVTAGGVDSVTAVSASTAFAAGGDILAFVGSDAPTAIIRTTDGGATWTDYPDTLWVPHLYADELGRPADGGGLASWIGVLDAGRPLISVPASIAATTEYRDHQIDGWYLQLLRRGSDPPGEQYYGSLIATGGTYEQLTSSLLGSQEYFVNRAGATSDGWLTAAYSDVLGRAVDTGARTYWDGQLRTRSRTSVASALVTSTEGLQDRVQAMYQRYLRRPADNGGLSYWTAALATGMRDESVVAALVSSAEYYGAAAAY